MKLAEKQQAIKLREKGCSFSEISNQLKVSKSTVSVWVSHVALSLRAKKILESKFTKGQLASQETCKKLMKEKELKASEFAHVVLRSLDFGKSSLLLLCAMIYWCEGTKSTHDPVVFMNSDPQLMATFLKLFRTSFKLDEKKFRVCVHLHEYHKKEKQLNFWSKTLTIPRSQFFKPYQKVNSGKYKKEGYEGCASVRYYDVDVARRLQSVAKAFMQMGP